MSRKPPSKYILILDTKRAQQNLPACFPILKVSSALSTLFATGLTAIAVGFGLLVLALKTNEVEIDYTKCDRLSSPDLQSSFTPPNVISWGFDFPLKTCKVKFTVQEDIPGPVYVMYGLTNFYQNHRKYVNSISHAQLEGKPLTYDQLGSCKPLDRDPETGKIYFPCGLRADSFFSDNFLKLQREDGTPLHISESGIAWEADKEAFINTNYSAEHIVPPPMFQKRGFTEYTEENKNNIVTSERFMVWMKTSPFSSFRKLYGKTSTMKKGTYLIDIESTYDVSSFSGTKTLILSGSSIIGTRNFPIAVLWISFGALILIVSIATLIRHSLKSKAKREAQDADLATELEAEIICSSETLNEIGKILE